MAIPEQCENCRIGASSCRFYDKDNPNVCQNYVKPIDNSGFFSNFFSLDGRIGRLQYLVMVLIGLALSVLLFMFFVGTDVDDIRGAGFYDKLISNVPLIFMLIWGGIKRCNDTGDAKWMSLIVPISLFLPFAGIFIFLIAILYFCLKKGQEGLNENGTEPLKPYQSQVGWPPTQM